MSASTANALLAKIIRDAVEAHGFENVPEAVDSAALRIRADENGVFATDWSGARTDRSVADIVADVARMRPELLKKASPAPTGDNPFVKGPGFSITRQMVLFKTDPATARRLEAAAQKKTS